jgi:hypothetical protein
LGLTVAACSAANGARVPAPTEDHSTDAGERHRSTVEFAADDHTLDSIERQRGNAFSD